VAGARFKRRYGIAVLAAIGAAVLPANAGASARPTFSTGPDPAGLSPSFAWGKHDYAVRCDGTSIDISVTGAPDWRTGITGAQKMRSGSYDVSRPLGYSRSFTVAAHRAGARKVIRFYVRCLPSDFPAYDFQRMRPGGPKLFTLQMNPYATVFSSDGAPIWWYDSGGSPNNVEVLDDGTITWDTVDPLSFIPGIFEIHRLDGSLVRNVTTPGADTDLHELIRLPNGNYLLGGRTIEHHQDASAFGGSADGDVVEIEIQEVTPKGKVVWKWDSAGRLRLRETPQRWWDSFILPAGQPYDVIHWNAAEPDGKLMLLSFRHLDAVYAINRRTGHIAWKLGGTETKKSLTVRGDPQGDYPLGGQHDVRVLPDGTISIHDNDTGLPDGPRVAVYRINPEARVARLVSSLSDPGVPMSFCCGSARLTPAGGWFVGWGGNPVTTAYDENGRSLYSLTLSQGFSYRATPVPHGLVMARDFRHGMNSMGQ
jgi:Arylsulfotransferase (ASST)